MDLPCHSSGGMCHSQVAAGASDKRSILDVLWIYLVLYHHGSAKLVVFLGLACVHRRRMRPIILTNVPPAKCTNPACQRPPIDRHHMGCEGMWIRHFRRRARYQRYRDFCDRYYEFRPEDCAWLCRECHRTIHRIYFTIIARRVRALDHLECKKWSWEQAEDLMAECRRAFADWIKKNSQ